jgi:dGTPase
MKRSVKGSRRKANRPLYRNADTHRIAAADGVKETTEPYRTKFRRDYQRLIHSFAFRRLQGKTQLFPSEENDFYRTRLTHSLEVAQIGKSIAIRLNNTDPYFEKHNIDTDLIEFAGLAHDLGHPPFGHNGEYILDELMMDHGGFEGNAQTLRILSKVEQKSTTEFPPVRAFSETKDLRCGLNLTYRSIAAVLKYDRMIPLTKAKRKKERVAKEPCKGYYSLEAPLVNSLKETLGARGIKRFKTIECSIMDVADDIAYSTYDIEDSFASGFLNPISILAVDDSDKEKIADRIRRKLALEFSDLPSQETQFSIDDINSTLTSVFSDILNLDDSVFRREWSTEELATSVGGEVYRASTLLAKSPYHRTQFTSDLISLLINKIEVSKVTDSPIFWQTRLTIDAFIAVEALKMICYTQLISSDKFLAERRRAKFILQNIFDALVESGSNLLPNDWRVVFDFYKEDEVQKYRTVCDFVSGMTNRYCKEFHERLFGMEPPSIHKP